MFALHIVSLLLIIATSTYAFYQWQKYFQKWLTAEEKCRMLAKQNDKLFNRIDERVAELEATVSAAYEEREDDCATGWHEEKDYGPDLIPEDLVASNCRILGRHF